MFKYHLNILSELNIESKNYKFYDLTKLCKKKLKELNPFKSNLEILLGIDDNKMIISNKYPSFPSIEDCYVLE